MSTVEHDVCIFLGDYFDHFGDSPKDAEATAIWLRDEILPNPKVIPLIGNHDLGYFWWWNTNCPCSGYTKEKKDVIRSILNQDHVKRFKFYHIQDGWAYSHAGLAVRWWKHMTMSVRNKYDTETPLQYFDVVMKDWMERTVTSIEALGTNFLMEPGYSRGGTQNIGGLIWCDWTEFASIKGVNQIVGHTPHRTPEIHLQHSDGSYVKKPVLTYLKNRTRMDRNVVSVNYDLDTHSNHYAIVTDGVVEIWDVLYETSLTTLLKFCIPDSEMNRVS